MVYKTVTKYGCDFSQCRDVVRCTVVAATMAGLTEVVRALLAAGSALAVVRAKNRFVSGYDARPGGGYLDVQLQVVFQDGGGRWHWGEVQVNLERMVEIKARPGGGHEAFKYARSLAAFDAKTFVFSGSWSDDVAVQIESGVVLEVDLQRGDVDPARLGAALASPRCRVTTLE